MKKVLFITSVFGIALLYGSWAMALDAPTGLSCAIEEDDVYFDWDDVAEAVKYSVDVEVMVDLDGDGTPEIVELSFGTSDRTDDGLMEDSDLYVPLTDFVYDLDGDGIDDQLSDLAATGKVKALAPGKGKGRQNNPFSIPCDFTLPPLP
jgi:hypothetical protein